MRISCLGFFVIITLICSEAQNLIELNSNHQRKPTDQTLKNIGSRIRLEKWVKGHLVPIYPKNSANIVSNNLDTDKFIHQQQGLAISRKSATVTAYPDKKTETSSDVFEGTTILDVRDKNGIRHTTMNEYVTEKTRQEKYRGSKSSSAYNTVSNTSEVTVSQVSTRNDVTFVENGGLIKEKSFDIITDERAIQLTRELFQSFKTCVRSSLLNAHKLVDEIKSGAGVMFQLEVEEFDAFIEKSFDFEQRCPNITNILKESVEHFMKRKLMFAQEQKASEIENTSITNDFPFEIARTNYRIKHPEVIRSKEDNGHNKKLSPFIGPLLPIRGYAKLPELNNQTLTLGTEL